MPAPDEKAKGGRSGTVLALAAGGFVLAAAIGVAVFVGPGAGQNPDDSSEKSSQSTSQGNASQSEETSADEVAKCFKDEGFSEILEVSTQTMQAIGLEAEFATAIGTRSALESAVDEFQDFYAPTLESQAQLWRGLDDCGDPTIGRYNQRIAGELDAMAAGFRSINLPDVAGLTRAMDAMTRLVDITEDYASYIDTEYGI